MADKKGGDAKKPKKANVTGSYPGVTGSYRPRSAYSQHEPAPQTRSEAAREQASGKEKKPFDFKLWFSKENNRTFLRQLRYYGLIVIASLLLTAGIVSLSNDVFAFIKPDRSTIVTIEQGGGTSAIAKVLKSEGIIKHPLIFRLYCKLKKADGKFQYGDYTLNSNLGYDQIISALKKPSVQAESYTFTISDGETQDDIVERLVSDKRVEQEEIENALNEYDYKDFEFVKSLPERRCRLEGYLPAGDYEFFVGESAVSMVTKILTHFNETVNTEQNAALLKQAKMSLDEAITLASLLQSECSDAGEYKNAAQVLKNRLKDSTGLLKLTCTINYVLDTPKATLSADDKMTESKYNTYVYAGLPPGPICTPSAAALSAAMSPAEGDNMYFISDGDKTYFAKTAEQHADNLKKASDTAKGTDTIR